MRVMTENPMGRQRSGWRYKLYRAGRGIQRNWGLYLLLLPAVVLLFCFNYLPMYGVQIAFRDFSPSQGIQGSPWVGLANFQKFFNSFQSKNLIWNTVSLSLYSLIAGFPFPIILALMVNQIRVKRFKQVLQVVTYPLYFIIIASFSNPSEVSNGNVWFWPSQFTLDGYKELLRHGNIWMGYWNTILYTVVGTAIGLIVNISAAYSLSRRDLVGRKLITFYFIFTMFFNGGLIPTYFTIRDFHLYDTFWVMVLPFSVMVYNMIVARTFFDSSLPKDLLDAAQIDGCGNLRFFFSIALPLSKAVIAVIALYIAVAQWNSYFNALVYIRNENLKPLQLVVRNILITNQSLVGAGDGLAAQEAMRLANLMKYAVIIITTVPIMCMYPFVQKYFSQGVMIGAIKG